MRTKQRAGTLYMATAFLAVMMMLAVPFVMIDEAEETDAITSKPTYSVIFVAEGTSGGTYTAVEGQTIELPVTTFQRDGYVLQYWQDDKGTNWAPGGDYTVSGDVTFTAQWKQTNGRHVSTMDATVEPGTTVSYNVWQHTFDMYDQRGSVTFDHTYDWWLPTDENEHSYAGAVPSGGVYYFEYHMVILTNPQSYWFVIQTPSSFDESYAVRFTYDSDVTVNDATQLVSKSAPVGMSVTLPDYDAVSKSGFTLIGWRTLVDGIAVTYAAGSQYTINPVTARVDVGEPIVFEAYFEPVTNAVVWNTFNAPGVFFTTADTDSAVVMKSATPGADQAGMSFSGWTLWNDDSMIIPVNAEYMISEGTMFNGYWYESGTSTYTVTFNGNGGVSENGTVTAKIVPGMSVYLPTTGFVQDGYVFKGWSTSADGTALTATSYKPTGNVTLYAVWESISTPVQSIQINGESTVYEGSTITLEAITFPTDADDRRVVFSYYNSVGQVQISSQTATDTGGTARILGISAGTVTITATAADGSGVSQTKTITVLSSESHNYVTLKYDANGGSGAPSSSTVDVGTGSSNTFTVSSIQPTRTGYTFKGWSTTVDGTAVYGHASGQRTTINVTGTTTLYAVWEEIGDDQTTFKLVYNSNGGSWSGVSGSTRTDEYIGTGSSHTFTIGSAQPTRSGYAFEGWATSSTASTAAYSAGDTVDVTGTTTLYAVWSANLNTFTLRFNPNNGTGGPDPITKTSASMIYTMTVPSDEPTRAGYSFLGWSFTPSATSASYTAGDPVQLQVTSQGLTIDRTLYAVWGTPQTILTLKYDANGGVGAPGNQTETINTSSESYTFEISETEPTREGYSFLGWATVNTASEPSLVPGGTYPVYVSNPTVTLYAVWERTSESTGTEYVLSYDANGGSGAPGDQTGTSEDGSCTFTISEEVPTRENHEFKGWCLNADGSTTLFQPGKPITLTGSFTLYAIWEPLRQITYTLAYDANGGTGAPRSETHTEVTSGDHTFTISSSQPTRDGYWFLGWSTSETAMTASKQPADTIDVGPDETVTLYAVWEEVSEKITLYYDANGGKGAPDAQESEGNPAPFTISDVEPTRDGYLFLGWNVSSDATDPMFYATDKVTFDKSTILYAVWQEFSVSYLLAYDLNGGTGEFPKDSWTGSAFSHTFTILGQSPSKSGSTFVGWATSADAKEAEYGPGQTITLSSDKPTLTLFALWMEGEQKVCIVSFSTDGGSEVAPIIVKSGAAIEQPDDPTKTGYRFLGWFVDKDTKYDFSKAVTSDIVLYAHWEAVGGGDGDGDGDDGDEGDSDGSGLVAYAPIALVVVGFLFLAVAFTQGNPVVAIVGLAAMIAAAAVYLYL